MAASKTTKTTETKEKAEKKTGTKTKETKAKETKAAQEAKAEEVKAAEEPKAAGEKKDEAEAPALPEVPVKPLVEYDAFDKCEFRVCRVLACEPVKKSKKLLCFKLQCGAKEIQILSGIKKWYPEPEKLVGKDVIAIVNLKPAVLAGMESQGMLLSAADEQGNLSLLTTMSEMAAGSEVG